MLTDKKISVVTPCYHDAGSLREMHRRVAAVIQQITPNWELVYVNDASPDNAWAVLRELAAADRRVIAGDHARNFGAEAAYTAGLRLCTGDAAIMIDGDLQDPPELFVEFVRQWLAGAQVVYGVRRRRPGNPLKRAAYRLFYRIYRRLSYLDIPVDAGDFGLLDRRVVDEMNRLPESDRFLRGLRTWVGFRQVGVPYERAERYAGRSASGLVVYLRAARRGIFSFSYAPLELVSYLAAAMAVLTFAALLFYLGLAVFAPAPRGFLTQLVIILVLSAMQFLCLAVIAEYVGRTFEEVKRRPTSIIREILNDPRPKP